MKTIERDEQSASRRKNAYAFRVAFVAAVGGFLFGYDLSLIGAANVFLREQFHLSAKAFGFATGSAALGCVFGPFFGAWLCDRIGREKTMIVASLLLAIGAMITALAPTILVFNVFRIVGGVGVGLCSIASPMYIAEIAPARKRGRLGIMYQLAIILGSTAAPLIAYFLVMILPSAISWRWMFGSQVIVVLIFTIFLFFLPRSPRWLAERGRHDEALDVLTRVDSEENARKELQEIKESLEQESGKLSELFLPGIRYALVIGLLLAFFNNWTGWSAMGGYIPRLLEMSGLQNRSLAILQFSLTYVAMAVITLISISIVDRAGRRPLWMIGSACMAVFTGVAGLVFHLHLQGPIVLLVLVFCAVPHGLALGPLPWLMMSEIFPTKVRAKAVAVTTTFLWLIIFTCAQFFPMISSWSEKVIGSPAGVFWVFTLVCIFSMLFGWKMLPETKGRTLESIARSWDKGRYE
ncbi:MAG: sugar porter family MFS transporter [Armatimonadota bacterium]